MRRYNEFEQLVTKDAASGLLRDPWTQLWLAEVKFDQGDPVAAQSLLEQVPLDFSPIQVVWEIRSKAALYLRDYDAADRVIAAIPAKFADRWPDGLVAVARGDKQKAQSIFLDARKRLDARWGDKRKDAEYFAQVSIFDAGLGRKEEAIREARRAVDLKPIAKDSLQGPQIATSLALVYAWTGERDRALEQLEIVATIPAGPIIRGSQVQSVLGFFARRSALRQDRRRSQSCQQIVTLPAAVSAQTAKSLRADNNRSRSAYRSEASPATPVSLRSFFQSPA
jgi:tetratricopeptide (TPR) repeat protein